MSRITMVGAGMMASALSVPLRYNGHQVRIVGTPLDEEIILKAAKETGRIVTAEEHSIIGGLGSAVAEVTSRNCPVPIRMVGQQDTFGESGKPDELLEKYGMTAADIVQAVRELY